VLMRPQDLRPAARAPTWPTLPRFGGGGQMGAWPRNAGLRGPTTHFIQTFKKRVFQHKFWPKYA